MSSKDYKVEPMSVQAAYDLRNEYPFALVYCYSDMSLCEPSTLTDKKLKECKEARFFGPTAEIHVLPEEDRAVKVTEISQTAVLDKEYKLRACSKYKWKSVVVRQYLEADEDGQMVIGLTRLMDLKGGQ